MELPTTNADRLALAATIVARVSDGYDDILLVPGRADESERATYGTLARQNGRTVHWAVNGFAIVTRDRSIASQVLMRMLDSGAEQITILARESLEETPGAELARFLEHVLVADVDTSRFARFQGILFDEGTPIKVIDRDGHHPVVSR